MSTGRPSRARGSNARARGTNTRARRTNPRAMGTNPTASELNDQRRAGRSVRQALARHYVATGSRWCLTCEDTGWMHDAGTNSAHPCPNHRQMTTRDAWDVLHPE